MVFSWAGCHNYRKDGLCRVPNALPGTFYRAHDKGHSLPWAYDTPHGSDKRTVQISLSCVVPQAHGKERPLPCVGQERTAKRRRHVRHPWHGGRLGRTLTVVSLCRAPHMKRTAQMYLCRAFHAGARQRLFKTLVFWFLLICPLQMHYFVPCISNWYSSPFIWYFYEFLSLKGFSSHKSKLNRKYMQW
jgi:hypothetical protein